MGEYGKVSGERVKLGTCEDMLYLRADQAAQVQPEQGSLDPRDAEVQKEIRFRFPWPDEDGTAVGEFERPDRAVGLYGVQPPAGVQHHKVQFTAPGYVVSLPCPEGPFGLAESDGLIVHRNGFPGPVKIVQQAYREEVLAVICQCGGCGARYNLPTLAEAEPVIVACRSEADTALRNKDEYKAAWWHGVADRIAAGYGAGVAS